MRNKPPTFTTTNNSRSKRSDPACTKPDGRDELEQVCERAQHESPAGEEGGELGGLAGHAPRADEGRGDQEEGQCVEDHLQRRVPPQRKPPVYELKSKMSFFGLLTCYA